MKPLLYISALCLLFLACSTTDNNTISLIRCAERIAKEYPDSALRMVRTIDTRHIGREEDMMHYNLVVSEVAYYNRLGVDVDSLTAPLFDYYYHSRDHHMRARALYQHALVKQRTGDNAHAMFSLHEALISLDKVSDPHLAGLVHRTMGEIYGDECLFQNAAQEYAEARYYFDEAGLDDHSVHAAICLATSLVYLRDYESAITLLCDLDDKISSDEHFNTFYMMDVHLLLCSAYIATSDFISCSTLFDTIDKDMCIKYRYGDYLIIDAFIDAYEGKFSEAADKLKIAEKEYVFNTQTLYFAKYKIADMQGDYWGALNYYKELVSVQDESVNNLVKGSILNDRVQFLEREIDHKKQIISKNRGINTLTILLSVVIISVLAYVSHNRAKHRREYVAMLREHIDDVKRDLEKNRERCSSLQLRSTERERQLRRLQELYTRQLSRELHNINDLLDAYYSDQTKLVKQRKLIGAIDDYIDNFSSSKNGYSAVELFVNESLDNIMVKLRSEISGLKECDYRLLCLVYANFSTNAMCLFLGYDKNKLYKRKSKLKAVIGNSDAVSKEAFLKNLK